MIDGFKQNVYKYKARVPAKSNESGGGMEQF